MDIENLPDGNPWGLESLMDIGEVAAYLRVPVSTVYDWRTRGAAPQAYRWGKHLVFAVSDVREWREKHREPPRPRDRGWPDERTAIDDRSLR